MTRYVYDFAEGADLGRELLGGKGAGLAEMTTLGIPVPAGFTVTTQACVEYMQAGKELPAGLGDEIEQHLARLEETTGKRLGDRGDPLLVSVRSGAAVSMPGMMDTILNLGLNDEAVEGLAATTGNARFAYDAYRRLLQMYGEVVDGVSAQDFEGALTALKDTRAACARTSSFPQTTCESSWDASRRSTGTARVATFRRSPESSWSGRSAPSSTPGRPRGRRCTGALTTSQTTSGRP